MGTIWRLKDYGTRYKWRLIASALAMFASTVSVMVVPRILGEAIDQALATGLRSRLLVMAAIIVGISVATAVFGYLRNYLAESVSQRACYDLRNDFFRKLQDLSFGFHDRQQTGDLMSRATSDVEAVRWFFRMGIIGGLSTVVMVAAVSGLMLVTNWRLAMVAIAFVPLVMWRAVAMAGGLVLIWLMVQIETGKMTAVLQENLSGIRIVRAFGARKHEESKFEEKAAALSRHTYSSGRILASQGSLMTFIFTAATAVILWLGGREIDLHGDGLAGWPTCSVVACRCRWA